MSKQIDWAAEIAAWRASGMTARKFCESRGYSATRLYWWSSQLKRSESSATSPRTGTVPMARVVRELPRSAPARAPIVIQVGSARVEVGSDVDRAALRMVLQVLADAATGAES